MTGLPSLTVRVEKLRSSLDGLHELVGDADGVVGVLEEDGGEGFGVGAGAVVAGGHQGPGLLLFDLDLALDEVFDVGVVDVEDDHLGGAAGLAAGLDDAGEGVEAAHEGERAGGGAAAGEGFHGAADGGEVGAGAGAPLEEHAFGLGEGQDRVERILYGVDEAGGALGFGVAGDGEGTSPVSLSQCQFWASELGSRRSQPTLNQTGELKATFWLSKRWQSSS